MKTVVLCTLGGVAVGCVTGYYVARLTGDVRHHCLCDPAQYGTRPAMLCVTNQEQQQGLTNQMITSFSELSMALGSPTASGCWQESTNLEFRLYDDLDNFPDLRSNRYV